MNNVTIIILNKKIDGKCWQNKLDITCHKYFTIRKEWATLHLVTSSAPTTEQLVLAKSVRNKLLRNLKLRIH